MRNCWFVVLFSCLFIWCAYAIPQRVWRPKNFWQTYRNSIEKKNALKRAYPIDQTVSLVIPCYHKHAPWLYDLLAMYEYQTRLPDEVIISLSEVHLVDRAVLARLKNERWAFPVKLITTKEQKNAGENRNKACEYAQGDIFICQDADDVAHKQRIEIIHYFFTQYAIDHLMHEFRIIPPGEKKRKYKRYNPCNIQFFMTKDFELLWRAARFTNGNVAISRSLFEKMKWPATHYAEDTDFNREVYKYYSKQCIVINAVLYGYRQYLSSHAEKAVRVDVAREVVYTKKPNQRYAVEVIEMKKDSVTNSERNVA